MRMTPRATAQRAVLNFGRVTFKGAYGDQHMMQQFEGSGFSGEGMKHIERPQNYGFRAVPMQKDESGGPEGFMSAHGGNPGHRIVSHIEDRRHTPLKMPAGASFQYNANGEGSYVDPKVGSFLIAGGSGGGSGGSVLSTTEVLTPDGFKNIGLLKVGDEVVNYDRNLKRSGVAPVISIITHESEKKLVELRYPINGRLRCTSDHKIWSETRYDYVAAETLTRGEQIRVNDKSFAQLEDDPRILRLTGTKVFEIETDGNHNFFARDEGTSETILVHNQATGGGSQARASLRHVQKQKQPRQMQSLGALGAAAGAAQSLIGQFKHQGENPTSELFAEMNNLFGKAEKNILHELTQGLYTLVDDKHVAMFADKGLVAWCDKEAKELFCTKPWKISKYDKEKPSPSSSG